MMDETKTKKKAAPKAKALDIPAAYQARCQRTLERLEHDYPDGRYFFLGWTADTIGVDSGLSIGLSDNNIGLKDMLIAAAGAEPRLADAIVAAFFKTIEETNPQLHRLIKRTLDDQQRARERQERKAAKTEYLGRKR